MALTEGRTAGAEVRFIDLPAWHRAFTDRPDGAANRYADAETRYSRATERLRARYRVDTVDALWTASSRSPIRTACGTAWTPTSPWCAATTEADDGDRAREQYMASWVRAAVAHAGSRPVLVVTGGFHQPALRALTAAPGTSPGAEPAAWPPVPVPPDGAAGGSFLCPTPSARWTPSPATSPACRPPLLPAPVGRRPRRGREKPSIAPSWNGSAPAASPPPPPP
ncbi:hypothetical protein GCM10023238_32020 [Streptomyces heliomycini]